MGRADSEMESYADFELSGYRWKVKSAFAKAIKERVIPLVFSEDESSNLRVMGRKRNRDSFIAATDDTSHEIFIKVHSYERFKDRAKSVFRASRARAEWEAGKRMFECGLPVAEPLGWGERRAFGLVTGCVLIARAIPGCEKLSDYLSREYHYRDPETTAGPDEFLRSLGALVRRMHEAGFRHPDLHPSNMLVNSQASPPNIWLIDLHSASGPSTVSHRARSADLAKMVFSLRGFLKERYLLEVLAAYDPDSGEAAIRKMLAALLAGADVLHKRRVKSRARRCLKTSGLFVAERVGENKFYRRREFETDAILRMIRRHAEIHAEWAPGLLKSSTKGVLTKLPLPGGTGENIYVKEYANAGFVRFLETVFYTHRGKRAWKAGHRLHWLGIPTAELIALVERGSGLFHTSYLIMKEIPQASRLNVFLLRNYFRMDGRLSPAEAADKRELIRNGARALRDFHSKRIYHKDLSAKNLLVSRDDFGKPCFYCVDTDSIQFTPYLLLRRRIKNLAQLNGLPACVTTADRVRFYMEYFGLKTLTPTHKFFIRRIYRLSRRRRRSARRIDDRIRENFPLDEQAYEDITSV